MKTIINRLILLTLLTLPATSMAFEAIPTNKQEYVCYSQAMIGYDSVINSRLGVPAEHALDLASLSHLPVSANQPRYSKALLKTILDAYLWSESPHSYAIKVFYRCAQDETTRFLSVQNDVVTTTDF